MVCINPLLVLYSCPPLYHYSDEKRVSMYKEDKVVPVILTAMKMHYGVADVQESGCGALMSLAYAGIY